MNTIVFYYNYKFYSIRIGKENHSDGGACLGNFKTYY